MVACEFDTASIPEQIGTENTVPPGLGSIDIEPVPKERGKRAIYASIIICSIAGILVIAFCFINGEEEVYYLDKTQKNITNGCYKKEVKLKLSGLFTTRLGLFSVVIGTLVDRLLHLAEEYRHLGQRYDGSCIKMIKACFSGILWLPVFLLLLLTSIIHVIIILTTHRPWFKLSYLVYIFSGIGVGPLIMRLLNLNTESKVYISTILEEKGTYVANGLAWSYYFNYLERALLKFKNAMRSPLPFPHGKNVEIQLSLDKLLLLVPLDCHTVDDLNQIDNQIERLVYPENSQSSFHLPVYRLKVNEGDKYFAIEYVKEPLKALRRMSLVEGIEAVKRKTCDEDVKLLYRTLFKILADPLEQDIKETCILVPIKAKSQESLKNGGLVKCIIDVVNRSCTQTDGVPGFVKAGKNVDVSQPKKATDKSSQSSHARPTKHDKKQGKGIKFNPVDLKKKAEKILKRQYKDNTVKKTEQQKLVSETVFDSFDTNNSKPNEAQRLVQETGNENNGSGANTSGINMVHIANGSQHSNQQERPLNDGQDKTVL